MTTIHGWLNIYKPLGISSAKVVSIVKKLYRKQKIGHCGTLDVEAEGVLPLAIGEATKLTRILVDAKKSYIFTIKFGAKTDTADSAGQVIETTDFYPVQDQCYNICSKFIGYITQIPPKFSALKIAGVRAYKLAREQKDFEIQPRTIQIYDLKCLATNDELHTATYLVQCSKGTYVRSLAEDIALSLQSLGFVLELRRVSVGQFELWDSVKITDEIDRDVLQKSLEERILPIETVLDDILVLDANLEQAQNIRYGVAFNVYIILNCDLCWVRHQGKLLAIGSVNNNCFKSLRVFNIV